jgi:hypothetical protein
MSRIGVSLAGDRTGIQVHFLSCLSQAVRSVRVEEARPGAPTGKEHVLWEITSEAGSKLEAFTIGQTPDGFKQSVALTRSPAQDELILAVVDTTTGSTASIEFRSSDLKPDKIFVNDRPNKELDPTSFRQRAEGTCKAV